METNDTLFTLWIGVEVAIAIFLIGTAVFEIFKNRLLANFLTEWERAIQIMEDNPAFLAVEAANPQRPLLSTFKKRYEVFDNLVDTHCVRMSSPVIKAMIWGNIFATAGLYYTGHYDLFMIGLYNSAFFLAVGGVARYFNDHLLSEAFRMARYNDRVVECCGKDYCCVAGTPREKAD